MKFVVFGAGGLLGRHVVATLRAMQHEVRGYDRTACDITDKYAVAHAADGADVVVNCAAFAKVDASETSPEARRVNALGAENVALAARATDAKCVHVSTDFVFDGTKDGPYDEDDEPNPLFAYGRTKREGEERVLAVGGRAYVVRVQSLYGEDGSNFPSKLIGMLRSGTELQLDCQRLAQPTPALLAAKQLVEVALKAQGGIYHVSCSGATTWAGFAHAVCEEAQIRSYGWREISSVELGFRAPRPAQSIFSHRAMKVAGIEPVHWRDGLRMYLQKGL